MIHRVKGCFGIPLWKTSQRYFELWVCLTTVKPHRHPGQSSEIIPLFGWSNFFRVTLKGEKQKVVISPRKWFRAFSVPADWVHWFDGVPLVFLNIANRPQSAGVNLAYET